MVNKYVYKCINNVHNLGKLSGMNGGILDTDTGFWSLVWQPTVQIHSLIHYFVSTFSQVLSTSKNNYLPVLIIGYTHYPQGLLLSLRV